MISCWIVRRHPYGVARSHWRTGIPYAICRLAVERGAGLRAGFERWRHPPAQSPVFPLMFVAMLTS